jgi:endonuclease/exonuclease/phosphatase family metal-dependent hydrolase
LFQFSIALFMSVAMIGAPANAEPLPPLRFVTYNLLHGGASSGLFGHGQELDLRLETAAAEIESLGADVIGLQEASASWGRGNVAARLAARLGFHYVHAPATERVFGNAVVDWLIVRLINFSEGPAIVSRFPIGAREVYDLPRCEKFLDPRVLLGAEILTPWGRLTVYSTHTSRFSCQAGRVAEIVSEKRRSTPSIVMGDFNSAEGSPAIVRLTGSVGFVDVFRSANPAEPGLTVWQRIDSPTPTVFRRVDYLFLVPGTEFPGRVGSSRVVLNSPRRLEDGKVLWPSDHYGVFGELAPLPNSSD